MIYLNFIQIYMGFPGGLDGKESACSARDLGSIDSLEEGVATHSSILAWRNPWTEEPGRLQSTGSQRVRHDWRSLACKHMKKKIRPRSQCPGSSPRGTPPCPWWEPLTEAASGSGQRRPGEEALPVTDQESPDPTSGLSPGSGDHTHVESLSLGVLDASVTWPSKTTKVDSGGGKRALIWAQVCMLY